MPSLPAAPARPRPAADYRCGNSTTAPGSLVGAHQRSRTRITDVNQAPMLGVNMTDPDPTPSPGVDRGYSQSADAIKLWVSTAQDIYDVVCSTSNRFWQVLQRERLRPRPAAKWTVDGEIAFEEADLTLALGGVNPRRETRTSGAGPTTVRWAPAR